MSLKCDPSHITALALPWSYKDIYDLLDTSQLGLLRNRSGSHSSPDHIVEPFAAYSSTHGSTNINNTPPTGHLHRTIALHTTTSGHGFLSDSATNKTLCGLCENNHTSPWHSTSMCPLRGHTFIQDKTARDKVVQYNAFHSRTQHGLTKAQDSHDSTHTTWPLFARIPATGHRVTFDPPATGNRAIIQDGYPSQVSPSLQLE